MKKGLLLVMLIIISAMARAQEREISGYLIDKDSKEAIPMVTVQLLKQDSTYVTGTVSNDSGKFVLRAPANERYILKMSSVGYITSAKKIQIQDDHNLNMGPVLFASDAVMLKEARITAQALKATVREDTFVYNSAAFKTPEGSTIEELVKRLPGAQVGDDGKITINGKQVQKILIDGKEFMTGDTKTAMKNIPTTIISQIKAYDQQSDLSRVTGIQDGDEQTVLDFGTKPGMNKGLMVNADAGVGTQDRYTGRVFGGYFNKSTRIMGMGNANNTNDMGFGRRGGFGGGRNGLNASKMAGMVLNYEKKDTIEINGSVRWNHSDGDVFSRGSSENFVSKVGSFGNSINQNYSRGDQFNAEMRLEWTPDTMTNIMFRPEVSLSTNDGLSNNRSASYNKDPYLYTKDPLSAESLALLDADSLMVNSNQSNSISYSSNHSYSAMLQFNRRLNSMGRNLTLRANANYGDGNSNSLSTNNVHLYQLENALGMDSTYQTNRYNVTPTKNWGYTLQATYSEPLWRATFLQLRYRFSYSYSKSDRATYDFSNLGENFFDGLLPGYRLWDNYLNRLDNPYTYYKDDNLSRFSEYKNYTHIIELMFRMIRTKYQLNAGVMAQPQHSNYVQNYQGLNVDTVRNVLNVSPTFDFRYRFNKVSNLRINYRANTSQPSISQLLDIYDDSNPLNISTGNPGLKPSFTQNFRLFYNGYFEKTKQSLMTYVQFSTTNNSISNKVSYNEKTGGRITKPENINGDWNMNGAFMFNTPLDTAGYWNVNTFTNVNYANNVGYLSLDRLSDSQKNTTKDLNINERLSGSYRNDWLEIELDGNLGYRHTRNALQKTANLDTWQYSYGINTTLNAPWGTALSTDLHMNSRRGFNDNSLNTNELVWNAQVSQSFLRGKPLTVMLQFYDILHNQSNLSRSISAMQRSDTEYNAINSYAMLHVNYRLNLFGGKAARQEMRQFGPSPRNGRSPRGLGGGGFGGHSHGGFGGPMMGD
ncbi:MAG: outer membrane beta-barrel protein [Bacteroidota bacterium]|nr:outer membrane beta-barrel protein [Bacteroidota bacterium]